VEEGEKNHGLVHAGLKALASLRLEKGYRDYGHDRDDTDEVVSTGLAFTCDFEKEGGFVGKDAVRRYKAAAKIPSERMVQVLIDDAESMLFHGEVLRRNDKVVGYVSLLPKTRIHVRTSNICFYFILFSGTTNGIFWAHSGGKCWLEQCGIGGRFPRLTEMPARGEIGC